MIICYIKVFWCELYCQIYIKQIQHICFLFLYPGLLINQIWKSFGMQSLTLFLMGILTNRTLWGADLNPSCYMAMWWFFFNSFFNRSLVLDANGQNPNEQPSTLKIVALRNCWKIVNFGKIPKILKIRYLEITFYIQKKPAKIKPRQVGCFVFF